MNHGRWATRVAAAVAAPTLFLMGLVPACSPTTGTADDPTTQTEDALTGSSAVSRADQWVNAKLHYCQSANHKRDYDTACSTYCSRTNNPQWDAYRSDCSGLVSWAWGLAAPGRVTTELAPFQNDITHAIAATDLQAGDAVNSADHVMLFKAWVNHGTRATFIEEPGCSSSTPYAHEFTSNVSISGDHIHVDWNGMEFTAIRYDKLTAGGGGGGTEKLPPKPTKACGEIGSGEGLGVNGEVKSCNGMYRFILQSDGNLVLYEGNKPLWASHTEGKPSYDVVMQGDGNLVIYDKSANPLWASGTYGKNGSTFSMQNDGNAVIYDKGTAVWASHTDQGT